jgi:hypothetical protein
METTSATTPIFFSLKHKNGAILYYLGIRHSRNPNDAQFAFIKEKWNEFLTSAKRPLAIVESEGWRVEASDEAESISKGGEAGFIGFLARKSQVPVISFEPDRKTEADHLLKNFSEDQIEYYYFARIISQWHRIKNKPSVEEYAVWHLKRDEQMLGWKDFAFSLEHVEAVHNSLFKTTLNLNDIEWFQIIENPTREENPLKAVVRASATYRDEHIISGVINAWQEKQNDVFMVYGSGHTEKHKKELIKRGGINPVG